PKRIFPSGDTINAKQKITKMLPAIINSQSNEPMIFHLSPSNAVFAV
ncbi:hypothetical protein D018_1713B, partial [Vibrio parahaemolyticus VP2007-007]